jgi:hypothetical protein
MDGHFSIRREFRKWWASNYHELLDSVVMLYVGITLLLIVCAVIAFFKG